MKQVDNYHTYLMLGLTDKFADHVDLKVWHQLKESCRYPLEPQIRRSLYRVMLESILGIWYLDER